MTMTNDFRQALLGYRETPTLPIHTRRIHVQSAWDYFSHTPEATLTWSAAVLLLLSLLATLVR